MTNQNIPTRPLSWALLLCTAALGMACGNAASRADVVLAGEVAVFQQLCACHDALSFDSDVECFKSFVARNEVETDCVHALFEANADDIAGTIDCQLEVIAEAQRCLDAVADCNSDDTGACLVEGLARRNQCGPYTQAVEHGLDVCYGVAPPQ